MNQLPLSKLHWEPFLYEHLCHVLQSNSQPYNPNLSDCPYMVFDFDETCITGDIEQHLMFYQVEHFAFKLSPSEMDSLLKNNLLLPNQETDSFWFHDLVEDIIEAYQYLWEHYHERGYPIPTDCPAFLSLQAKMIYYYYHIGNYCELTPGRSWPTYWFAEFSQIEVNQLVQNMLAEMTVMPRTLLFFDAHPQFPGRVYPLKSSFIKGIVFPTEIKELFRVASHLHIIPYIISASPKAIMQGLVSSHYLPISNQQVFAMPHSYQEGQIVSSVLETNQPLTRQEGKTLTIVQTIAPIHGQRGPLAVFGDSMGDYDMLTHFPDTELRVLMNRQLSDRTNHFRSLARTQYGNPKAHFFLQGKNYRTGHFIPSTDSLLWP